MTHKDIPCSKIFSSLYEVTLVFCMSPNLNILCTGSERNHTALKITTVSSTIGNTSFKIHNWSWLWTPVGRDRLNMCADQHGRSFFRQYTFCYIAPQREMSTKLSSTLLGGMFSVWINFGTWWDKKLLCCLFGAAEPRCRIEPVEARGGCEVVRSRRAATCRGVTLSR